ncbi:hypothetical protein [Legionella sp. CNM-4043-24]|uniref:hypothetical protein n=1 Tax=Legionella sp. CNM-4043-24 TaxID=3421646 RepID=UPI00403AE57A
MKEAIITLVNHIRELQDPIDLNSMAALFEPRPQWLDTSAEPPLEVQAHWAVLFRLAGKISAWNRLVDSVQLKQPYKENRRRIHELTRLINQHRQSYSETYELIFERYAAQMRKDNPILVADNPVDTRGKLDLLRDIFSSLRTGQQRLQLDEARLSLYESRREQEDVIEQLRAFNLELNADSDLQGISRQHTQQLTELMQTKEAFQLRLSELAAAMSQPDEQRKQDLQHQIQRVSLELSSLSEQLAAINLPPDTKAALVAEYRNPELLDKQDLLRQKQNAVPSAPYIHIPLWSIDPANSVERKSLDWLTLFHQTEVLTRQREELERQCVSISPLAPADNPELLNQIDELLRSFDPALSVTDLSLDGLAQCFVDTQARLLTLIEQKEQIKTLLSRLRATARNMLLLRTEHAALMDSGLLMVSPEEADEIRSQAESRQSQLQSLNDQLTDCQSIISRLEQSAQCEHEKKQLLKANKSIKKQIATATKTRGQQSGTAQLDILHSEIMHIIDELRTLPLVSAEPAFADEAPGVTVLTQPEEPVIATVISEDAGLVSREASYPVVSSRLTEWHNQIIPLLNQAFPEFADWYRSLYDALHAPEWMGLESLTYQKEQVLHDIYYELRSPLLNGTFTTLRAWQSLCPQPLRDWRRLTDLKLPVSPEYELVMPFAPPQVREQLTALRMQCVRLVNTHPREALLLAQLTRNLHKAALAANGNNNGEVAAVLARGMVDPRYECLHHHRGAFPLSEWLAKLFTSILGLFRAQAPDSYRHRFIFSPTRSVRLVEEALEAVTGILPAQIQLR